MRLKFLVTTTAGATRTGQRIYAAGETHEVKDLHACEVYIAHGYAVSVDGAAPTGETLKRTYPVRATEPVKAEPAKSEAKTEPAKKV